MMGRMVREVEGRAWGMAAEVESLWTAACFPSPCNCKDWLSGTIFITLVAKLCTNLHD